MQPDHESAVRIADIFGEVQNNLDEAGLKYYSTGDIMNSIQDQYNKIVAILTPIERATFYPQLGTPYYNFGRAIPDFMYVSGIYNPFTQLWLEGISYKQMKASYQTYLAIGNPKWFNIIDLLGKVLIWPYNPGAAGVFFMLYKASAPTITMDHIPLLPASTAKQMLEYSSTADLMEQGREFNKARKWWDRLLKPGKTNTRSVWDQCAREVKYLAQLDKEDVLEPYRWIFHGGLSVVTSPNWQNNETPFGTIDGANPTFLLTQTPNPGNGLLLMKNGQVLTPNVGYTLNGQTINFQSGYIPQPGDIIQAYYQII